MSRHKILAALTLALISLLIASIALAQSGYRLDWWTVDGGGGTSEGGVYSLSGTIGQADADVMSGGVYTLASGFWGGGAAPAPLSQRIFLPLTIK
jgi:hypothetical protein